MKSPSRGEVWLVDLNPGYGTEPGKERTTIIIQTDLLNDAGHPSTIICPTTSTNLVGTNSLRVRIPRRTGGLDKESEVLIDQLRSVDNRGLLKKIGTLPVAYMEQIEERIKIVLDLE